MKKVLLVTNIPAPYTVDLIYYMQTHIKDYEFHVLYTGHSEDDRGWEINNNKIINSVFVKSRILKIKTKYYHRFIHIPVRIGKEIDKIDPNIIIAWEYNIAAIQSMMWCKKHGRKYISLTEGTLLTERKLWLIQKLTRKYIKTNANAFLVSGTKAREKLKSWGISDDRIFTEYLTVDIEGYLRMKRSPCDGRLLYVGRFAEGKGLDLLFHSLKRIDTEYSLHIVGGGTETEKLLLSNMAIEEGISDKLVWCGYKTGNDLIKEYAEAQVFVFPTREDCFGLVLVEALAMHVPIVSSIYADGAYDVIVDGKNGYLVDPFSPEDLSNKIKMILNNSLNQNEVDNIDSEIIHKFEFSEVSKGFIEAIEYAQNNR